MRSDQLSFKNLFSERSFCLLLVLVFLTRLAHAQNHDINFTYLTSKGGLSSNTVYAILKDSYGLMWFATEDGLNKFDGTNVTVYRNNPGKKNSLKVNEITSLYQDKKGRLWIGTNGGSLSLYDRQSDSFIHFSGDGGPGQISSRAITSICSDYSGKIWIGTYGGLNVLDPSNGKIVQMRADPEDAGSLTANTVYCVFEDSKKNIWAGTIQGLNLYNRKTKKFVHFLHNEADLSSLSHNAVRAISEDQSGNIWIGTEGGLNMLQRDGKRFKRFRHSIKDLNTISSDLVLSIADDRRGSLWIGTEEGLNILNTATGNVHRLLPDRRYKHSLTSKSIRSILIDDQERYWVGTYQGGINIYDKNLAYFNLKESNSFDPLGLSAPVVTSFAEDASGDVFIGTDGGGLNLFHRKTGLFSHFDIQPKGEASPKGLSILALEKSKDKQLWIGTYHEGLFLLNPSTGTYKQFRKGNSPYDLNNNDVFCIMEDSMGDVWIGTNGGGINVYNPQTKTIKKYFNESTAYSPNKPSNNIIRAFAEDRNGNIWVGTYGAGISVFNRGEKKFKFYSKTSSNLPGDVVLSILEDHFGNIWAGTIDGGLSRLDKKTGKFVSYSEEDGLANNVVQKIVEDNQGLIWLSTNKGISRFNPETKQFKNYSYYNGLQNNAFVLGSGIKLSDGDIFFGGLEGFNYFSPLNLKTNKNVPRVLLTDLRVSNKPVVPGKEGSPLTVHISLAREINLNYKQTFSIGFVALNYTTSQQNNYAYKLSGFEKDWNYAGTEQTASYTNLDPGEYLFQVKASNNDGIWNEQGTSIKVIIKPPFWRTVYAYIFYAIVVISLLLRIRARGIRKLKRKFTLEHEKLQAKQVREQERKEAQRLHELDLMKIKFLTNMSHEFRTPISLIMAPVDKLLNQKKDQESFTQLKMIKNNARRLLNLVNQLLDFRKMEERELKLIKSEGEIISFMKEVFNSFHDLAERKRIDFTFRSQIETLNTTFDHDKIERILFNLLSNAFKFTDEGGRISLELEEIPQDEEPGTVWLSVIVADSGIGIPKDKQEKVFKRFFQDDISESILNQGSGIGLSIVKEFVKMHGGSIQLESEPGKGSSFTIGLPFIPNQADGTDDLADADEQQAADITYELTNETIDPVKAQMERPHILIVEDNNDFRFYLKDNLKASFRISEASNGKEGWQKALSLHPQLVVSDISMPVMDGIELSRKIKNDKRTCHTPVILLTAMTGEEEQLRGLETGANDYLTKPFNFEILNSRIKNLLVLKDTFKATYSKQIKVQAADIEIESEDTKFLNNVILYIEENLTKSQLSVEDLSKHIGMSRASLYRKILILTGETPVEFIRSLKLEKARILLEKSDLNIAQICYTVGFSTPNYFTKSFKAKYNMLPSEYLNSRKMAAT